MKIIKDSICCKKKEIEKQTSTTNNLASVTTPKVEEKPVTNINPPSNMDIFKAICGDNGKYQIYYWDKMKLYTNAVACTCYIIKKNTTEIEGSAYVELQSSGYIVKISSNNATFKSIVDELGKQELSKCTVTEFENLINKRPNFRNKRESFFDQVYFYFSGIGMYDHVLREKAYNKLINSSTISGGNQITYTGLVCAWKDWDNDFEKNTKLGMLGFFESFTGNCPANYRSFFQSSTEKSHNSCVILMLPDNKHFLKFKVGANRNEQGGWENVHRI